MANPQHLFKKIAIVIASFVLCLSAFSATVVSGDMKTWHPVIVTIDGPSVDESETTYRNYRLDVTFTKGTKSFKVPGFFAADGNAAESSATTGNKWRAVFTPDEAGTWNYSVSLRQGTDIAISPTTTGTAAVGDAQSGSFIVGTALASEKGFFAKGKLIYVGEHYGQFAGNKEWHVKAGPGSPEDFFGYKDFDNTTDWETRTSSTQVQDVYLRNQNGEGLHFYTPHVADWKTDDPTWKGGKGKGIIGALNYMATIGVNSLYMIPFTVNDDSDNTWPWTSRNQNMSYDVSKLAQWDIVFSHMDRLGISATYYFCECDNSKLLDNADMILKNPIYYREIIARFGYHLGIRFNLGEELRHTCEQQKVATKYFKDLDPYNTIICGHSSNVRSTQVAMFDCLLGDPSYDGPNYQLHEADKKDHLDLIMWRDKSSTAGKKWIVANDESWGIDNSTGSTGEGRMLAYAWRTYMAGAEGMFQYTAYGKPEIGDITMENFRLIENTQKIHISCKNLFLKPEINPLLHQMKNEDALVGNPTGNDAPFCFAKKGELYIVYRTSATNQKPLNLTGAAGTYSVKWYDAKNGGAFQNGSVLAVNGGSSVELGNPPSNATAPWAVVIIKNQDPCVSEKNINVLTAGYGASTVSGGGKYCINTTATLTANVAPDAEFVNWTENGNPVSTANPYSFSVTADRTLVANFIKNNVVTYTITTTESSSSNGSTSGGGQYNENQSVTVSATANSCFKFDNWTENDVVVSTNANYTFTANKVRNLKANFSTKTFNVVAEPAAGGSVSGQLNYVCGAVINVTATPNADYKFDGWYAGNTLVSTQLTDDINIGDDFQLKARFSLKTSVNFLEGSSITYYAPDMNALTYAAAKNVSIAKITAAPAIDGLDNEACWQTAPLFNGQTIGTDATNKNVRSNIDAQLSWKATWDNTYLYTIIKAKDDTIVWNDAFKIWNIDAIEFYVTKDAIANAETSSDLGRTTQAKVLWQNMYLGSPEGKSIIEFRGTDNTSLAGTKTPVVGTTIARTYDAATKTTTFEIRYEWTKILTGANAFTSVAENDKIRIGMMWNDNDNVAKDARDHRVYYVEKVEPNAALSHKDWVVVTLINSPTAIKNTLSQDAISLYPNPASGTVSFSEIVDADFYNLDGQKVLMVKKTPKANIGLLKAGIYQVVVNKGLSYKLVVY